MVVLAALNKLVSLKNARALAGVFVLVLASGCASWLPQTHELRQALPDGAPESVELTAVPFFPQDEYQCGPAALATVLAANGVKITPQELVPEVYLPERKGSLQVEMLAAARRHGLVSYQLAPRYGDVLREIAAGNPVVLLQNFGLRDGWHYAVAVGYDYDKGKLILRSGETERSQLPFGVNELVWSRSGYWAMVVSPPGRIVPTAQEERWVSALAAFERVADPGAARTAYGAALERWPQSVPALVGLANAHHRLKELPQAEAALRRAEKVAPDSVIVLNNLAQTLSDQGKDAEALPVIERAAQLGGPFSGTVEQTRREILEKLRKKG